jgi:hypothetical protein
MSGVMCVNNNEKHGFRDKDIQSLFEHKALSPIILDWQNVLHENGNLGCEVQVEKNSIRNSSQNKKIPVTRASDFLWIT